MTAPCDLPRVQHILADPEEFFKEKQSDRRIVLDEVHVLSNPSQVLKIAADEFPYLKIIATGSSTLAATEDKLPSRIR